MFDRFTKKEGILIAIITMVIYAATYFFERGYSIQLNIPLDYIEISIPTIVNDLMYLYTFVAPVALITSTIMLTCEKDKSILGFAKSPLLCMLAYFISLLIHTERTTQEIILCLFVSVLFSYIIHFEFTPDKTDSPFRILCFSLLLVSMSAFVLSFTFIAIGKNLAVSGSFPTYNISNKSYSLLKIYGENAFMREIRDDKSSGDLIYFNTKDMTGMTLK